MQLTIMDCLLNSCPSLPFSTTLSSKIAFFKKRRAEASHYEPTMGITLSRKTVQNSSPSIDSTQRRQSILSPNTQTPLRRSVFHIDSSSRDAIASVLEERFGPSRETQNGTTKYNWFIAEFPAEHPTEHVVLTPMPLTTADRAAIANYHPS